MSINPMDSETTQKLLRKVQVNIPFTMLFDDYLEPFITYKLNPEVGIDAAALERFDHDDFKRIAELLHDHSLNITLHGPFMDMSPGSLDPAFLAVTRKRLEQLLKLVPVFKPQTVVCHAGFDSRRYGDSREKWIENSLETWSWMASELLDAGTRLMLENVYENQPEDIGIILERLENKNVGFCLDCGHLSAFGKSAPAPWLESLGPYLRQVHLHDNRGDNDEHLAMGLGTIDFEPLFNHLKLNQNSLPIVTLEPHCEKDLWLSLEYLAKVWCW